MPSIDEIILRNTNPFDNIYCANFGNNQEYYEPTISYLHQETFVKIEALVSQVLQDHLTRTVLITGDTGCGKTYLLTRLKSQLNYKTCFVYIPPFAKRDSIWRWILRYVVDNLIKVTDDNQTSPLLLWLSTINEGKDTLLGFLRSEKQKFINKLKEKYKQVNIYHPDIFFAILYELTNPELSDLAGKYLRGDDLSEESLQALGVENSINTETTARETLSNFSRISCDVQPIILCFNQLESIARLPDGALDLNALFQVNAKIREDNNNFLIIISIATHTWEQNKYQIEESYQSHINQKVELRNISLAQAELILVSRLEYLHRQATSQLSSPLYPLSRQLLEKAFPRGRMNFRDVIIYGKNVFKEHKENLAKDDKNSTFTFYKKTQDKLEIFSYFKVRWYEEFSQSRQKITHISQISSPELIQFLQEILLALQIDKIINPLFIRTKYASYSLGYEFPDKPEMLGVVWTEDANLTSFFHVMEACRKTLEKNPSFKLSLIRSQPLGAPQSKGYKVYQDIFVNSPVHRYIIPDLNSVHYLATYHSLVRNAREGDLVIGSKIISLKNLQSLMATTRILDDCSLLQDLGIVQKLDDLGFEKDDSSGNSGELNVFKRMNKQIEWKEAKDYIFNLVITQSCLSRQVLLQKSCSHFPGLTDLQLDGLIQQLCWENKIKIIDSKAPPEYQLVCLFPKK